MIKHGHSKRGKVSNEYYTWQNMKSRCLNPNNEKFQHYGGRGVSICKRWLSSFENFLADMGHKPDPKMSIDRIDNDGDYEPSNCRWATQKQQVANQRKRGDNTSGIAGVHFDNFHKVWIVQMEGRIDGEGKPIPRYVGRAKDFFQACCMRKSEENKK